MERQADTEKGTCAGSRRWQPRQLKNGTVGAALSEIVLSGRGGDGPATGGLMLIMPPNPGDVEGLSKGADMAP